MKKKGLLIGGIILIAVIVAVAFFSQNNKPLEVGNYTAEVVLGGGSGRASIENPVKISVNEDGSTATIIWSSKFYEFMQIGEEKYMPIQKEGNSTFGIPIVFDEEMKVSAQTIAMSEAHIIDYTILFKANTLKKVN